MKDKLWLRMIFVDLFLLKAKGSPYHPDAPAAERCLRCSVSHKPLSQIACLLQELYLIFGQKSL